MCVRVCLCVRVRVCVRMCFFVHVLVPIEELLALTVWPQRHPRKVDR